MRSTTSSLATLLSVLMVSTSASASVCDLTCWLHQAHSDCHGVSSVTKSEEGTAVSMSSDMDMSSEESEPMITAPRTEADAMTDDSMSMPPDTDMGPDHSESMGRPVTMRNAILRHPMAMSVQREGVTERFASTMKVAGTRATRNHSSKLSSCRHEPCSQASISASPPTGDHPQPASLLWIPTGISNTVNLWTGSHWMHPETSPPEILAVIRLTTTLRI